MAKTGPKPKPLSERFWAKVERRGPDECWNWQAGCHPDGHGRIGGNGTMLYAHRVSYELHHGAIPPGMVVMHKCDNPRCVNPAHLQIGTPADNIVDMWQKGRGRPYKPPCGIENPNATITIDIAYQILDLRNSGMTQEAIAAKLGVSKGSVFNVYSGKHWTVKELTNS